jgi:hypothetical protein
MHPALPTSPPRNPRHLDSPRMSGAGRLAPSEHPRPAPSGARLLLGVLLTTLCIALPLAAFVGRAEIVRRVPETAALYAAAGLPVNLRGLSLDEVRSVEEIVQGEPILVVSGTITNLTKATLEVPRLRLAVRGAEPTELYAWTARVPETRLAPGQSTGFRARLAAPPEAGRAVAVRFEDAPKTRLGLR